MPEAHALFQLGMDLDYDPGTAYREVTTGAHSSALATGDIKDFFIERDGARYAGTHLIIDLWDAEHLDDMTRVEAALQACVEASGATLLHMHLHHFTPNQGVSGVAVLAESHISVHTWPERGYAALDVFMCGDTNPHAAVEVLRTAFCAKRVAVSEHLRGRAP